MFLVLMPLALSAQSSDAAYPEGTWINELPGEENRPYNVEIQVKRVTEKVEDYDGLIGCGYIRVSGNNVEYEGLLTYHGKGLKSGVGNGIYYFDVKTKDGHTDLLGIKKTADLDLRITSITGAMADNAFKKETLFLSPMNGSWTPATIEVMTEKELLKALQDAQDDYDKDRIAYRTRGYGNVQQYIKAHKGLNANQPKYAKVKGTAAVAILEKSDESSEKTSEMKAGQPLLVVDEYNGWCQVKLGTGKYGWVPLSSVTLTNNGGSTSAQSTTASSTATSSTAATAKASTSTTVSTSTASTSTTSKPATAKSFVLGNGKLGPLSIGQTISSLTKSVDGLYDSYKVVKEERADEEESWTETWVHFYKGGKVIFKAFVDDANKFVSFTLEEGSSFIKTTEGYYVGYNARELFNKKRMTWETWYMGTAFARKGHFEFHIPDDGLQGADFPSKASDIKATAKISQIIYYKDLPQSE